jgi:hypothetical protein
MTAMAVVNRFPGIGMDASSCGSFELRPVGPTFELSMKSPATI